MYARIKTAIDNKEMTIISLVTGGVEESGQDRKVVFLSPTTVILDIGEGKWHPATVEWIAKDGGLAPEEGTVKLTLRAGVGGSLRSPSSKTVEVLSLRFVESPCF